MTDEVKLEVFESMLRAATPGPWRWDGNLNTKEIYLVSNAKGRPYVMDFARWGMRGAAPCFQVRQSDGFGVMTRVDELAVKEREYRGDIERIEHPDAALIASAPDIIAELIEMAREKEAEIERLKLQIECDARDPAHENCRNGLAQVERQRDVAEAEIERLKEASASVNLDALVERFLVWPVPSSVCPDGVPGKPGRTGTNLLTAAEAREMLVFLLDGYTPLRAKSKGGPCETCRHQDGPHGAGDCDPFVCGGGCWAWEAR